MGREVGTELVNVAFDDEMTSDAFLTGEDLFEKAKADELLGVPVALVGASNLVGCNSLLTLAASFRWLFLLRVCVIGHDVAKCTGHLGSICKKTSFMVRSS